MADVLDGIRQAAASYPRCRIANCACDEYAGQWQPGCGWLGHWRQMDEAFGTNNWNLDDHNASIKAGTPIKLGGPSSFDPATVRPKEGPPRQCGAVHPDHPEVKCIRYGTGQPCIIGPHIGEAGPPSRRRMIEWGNK